MRIMRLCKKYLRQLGGNVKPLDSPCEALIHLNAHSAFKSKTTPFFLVRAKFSLHRVMIRISWYYNDGKKPLVKNCSD